MSEVLQRLKADHRSVAHLLDLLQRQLEVLAAGNESPNYELIRAVLDYLLSYPDLTHHPREDVVYRLLHRRAPQAAREVGDLLREHAEIGALTRRLAEAINRVLLDLEVPRQRLVALGREFVSRYRKHIAQEDAAFFPAAERHLLPEDWMLADSEFEATNDPLFGPEVDERFHRLRTEIDALVQDTRQ